MEFERLVVLITGGASGIGKATVRKFHQLGSSVVFADCDEGLSRVLIEELASSRAYYVKADIRNEEQVQNLVTTTLSRFGHIDVLVNNAAIFILKSIDATIDDWMQMLGVNILGQALVTKHVVEHMKRRRQGVIVNLGSISAVIAQKHQLTYNVTKAAMVEMTRCLALDLKEFDIRVNTVSPGWVMTENVRGLLYEERGLNDAQIKAEIGDLHLTGRLGEPAEVANVIAFVASDEASFINGANIMVDGGYTAI